MRCRLIAITPYRTVRIPVVPVSCMVYVSASPTISGRTLPLTAIASRAPAVSVVAAIASSRTCVRKEREIDYILYCRENHDETIATLAAAVACTPWIDRAMKDAMNCSHAGQTLQAAFRYNAGIDDDAQMRPNNQQQPHSPQSSGPTP